MDSCPKPPILFLPSEINRRDTGVRGHFPKRWGIASGPPVPVVFKKTVAFLLLMLYYDEVLK